MSLRGDATGSVLSVSGLATEARIAAGPGVRALAGGGDPVTLAEAIEHEVASGTRALISFGVAGALAPMLAVGSVIVARSVLVVGSSCRLDADAGWSSALLRLLPQAITADLLGSDAVIAEPGQKADLHARTEAMAVDMESHVVATIAARYGLPFVALRTIADPAERRVPPAARVAMRPGGGIELFSVLQSLGREPGQLADLFRIALDTRKALGVLRRSRRLLGGRLGYLDLDELALHVV